MKITKQLAFLVAAMALVAATGCKKDDDDDDDDMHTEQHNVTFRFKHNVSGDSLELDTMKYTNAFGNLYRVENLQYLVSNFRLHLDDGSCEELTGYHYVDIHDQSTWEFTPTVKADHGDYHSISFTMGMDEEDNITAAYPDLNLLNWGWPMMLGGGYHFMKLEGKYMDMSSTVQNFATHYGTAREITQTDTTFHQNYFMADLGHVHLDVDGDMFVEIEMDINNWYNDPPVWDFNVWNAPIMPIYDAQRAVRNNGHDVFSAGNIGSVN